MFKRKFIVCILFLITFIRINAATDITRSNSSGVVTNFTPISGMNLNITYDSNYVANKVYVDLMKVSGSVTAKTLTLNPSNTLKINFGNAASYQEDITYTIRYRVEYISDYENKLMSNYVNTNLYFIKLGNRKPNNPVITAPATGLKSNDNTQTFNWNYSDPDGDPQTKYQVVGSTNNFSNWQYNSGEITSAAKTHTTSALADGAWRFAIRTWDNKGGVSSWSYLNDITIDTVVPNNPAISGTFTNISDTSITLNWGAFSDSTPSSGYNRTYIYAERWNGSSWVRDVNIDNSGSVEYNISFSDINRKSYNVTGLMPGTKYRFIAARYYDKASNWGAYNFKEVWTKPSTPSAPTGTVTGLSWHKTEGRGRVVLNWQAQTGATGYVIYIWDGSYYRAWDVGNVTSFDTSVWKVYPTETRINQDADNTRSVDIFNHSKAGLDLRDDPSRLYLKSNSASYNTNKNYFFRVSAYNSSGQMAYSSAYMPTLPDRTDAEGPNDFTFNITTDSSTQITLSAGDVTDSGCGVPTNVYSYYVNGSWEPWTSSKTRVVTGLTPNTRYTYAVKVRDNLGNETIKPMTNKYTHANAPTGLVATKDATSKSMRIVTNWNSNANAGDTTYELEVSDNGTSGWTNVYTGSNLIFNHTGLTNDTGTAPSPGVTKHYRVRVYAKDGSYTSYTPVVIGDTLETPITTLEEYTSKGLNTGKTRLRINWNPVDGADTYRLWIYDGGAYRIINLGKATSFD
ncbi:MAG: fibronectin type III domain-containing protein, partial [Clostridia bacterium]|nr:fibronectin type III domain-containing protein [Clostridia bacterium]